MKNGPMLHELANYTRLYHQGRIAVHWAYRGMGLAEGTPAWFPSFHCGVEVEAAASAGFDVRFYRIGEALQVDLDDLVAKLRSRPGPVLVIHYFGFPQPHIDRVAEMCREAGVALIEDCTHALFSSMESTPLGSFGPIAVYSLAKFLAVYDGGALKVDYHKYRSWVDRDFSPPPETCPVPAIYWIFVNDCARRLLGTRLTDRYRSLRRRTDTRRNSPRYTALDEQDFLYQMEGPDYRRGMAWLSRHVARKASPTQIIERRRANYVALAVSLRRTSRVTPVFPLLPQGVCPLVFPVWVENRRVVERHLRNHGIHCYIFGLWRYPSLPADAYPDTDRARRGILGLPVHQYLDAQHMTCVAEQLARLPEDRQ